MLTTILYALLAVAAFFLCLIIFKYLTLGQCKIDKDLTGKITIVTGANTGLGKETAYALAKRGATVILACRNPEKTSQVVQEIKKRANSSKVEFMQLDLADMHSVKKFTETFRKKYDKLDILINNAGAFLMKKDTTKDGIDTLFATNYLGHFYLTTLLLDTLKKSAPSRVINLSSDAHKICKGIKRDEILAEHNYSAVPAYGRSKFATLIFAKELQTRLEEDNVKVVAVNPGMVRTELSRVRKEKWIYELMMWFILPFMYTAGKSVEEGIQTTLYCALEEQDKLQGGGYYSECKLAKENEAARKNENWVKLWDLSEEMISKVMNK